MYSSGHFSDLVFLRERKKIGGKCFFFFFKVHPHFVLYGMWIHAFRN